MAGAGQSTNIFTGNEADYSHDFQSQIAEKKANANEQYSQYAAGRQAAAQREAAYDEAFNNQKSYSDILSEADAKYGVDENRNAYLNSMRAIAATNQAMNTLPSTINANSNVVLNQAQRNAALSNQMGKYQNTLSSLQQTNAVQQAALADAYQRAAQKTQGDYAQQQANIQNRMGMYQTALQDAAQTYNQAIQQEQLLRDVYAKMYQDEYQHQQQEYNYWYGNLQDKWKQQELEAQKYAADAGMRVQQFLNSLPKETPEDNSFESYLMSKAAYGGDWAEGVNKDDYLNDMLYRWTTGDANERRNIMAGSNYADYLNILRGNQ